LLLGDEEGLPHRGTPPSSVISEEFPGEEKPSQSGLKNLFDKRAESILSLLVIKNDN
jgi:hypothetical protein